MLANTQLLRFTTAGSVDDGKSTLIGRLLYDSKSIFEDQLEAVQIKSKRNGLDEIDLAFFTDGLKDEREQGITIDVAYKYFTTPKRKFIIADTPGHIQYTRNMITGASTANAAIILIDAKNGIVEQTKRHFYIATLLGISHIVVCINKMDLVEFDGNIFNQIKKEFNKLQLTSKVKNISYIPISALKGDNVVVKSKNMQWYKGSSLLQVLETMDLSLTQKKTAARFPVQMVIRTQANKPSNYRGYAGKVVGGIFTKGDKITVLPSNINSTIKSIDTFEGEIEEAVTNKSIVITLQDDVGISRGDMIVKHNEIPQLSKHIEATLCWMSNKCLAINKKYILYHTTNTQKVVIDNIKYKIDINTLGIKEDKSSVKMNDIVKVSLKLSNALISDKYKENKSTGSFILVDATTNETVGAGIVE